jgi:hypothetical protein
MKEKEYLVGKLSHFRFTSCQIKSRFRVLSTSPAYPRIETRLRKKRREKRRIWKSNSGFACQLTSQFFARHFVDQTNLVDIDQVDVID